MSDQPTGQSATTTERDLPSFIHEVPSLLGPPAPEPFLSDDARRALDERLRDNAAHRWESRP